MAIEPAPSFWLLRSAYTPGPPLRGDATADVAICGGGFTGLWTAIFLKRAEPPLRVAVVEERYVGYGASGRNGGFAETLVHRSLADLARSVGDGDARALYRAAAGAVFSLRDFVVAEPIDCDLMPNGILWVSNGPEQDGRLEDDLRTADRLGIGGLRWLDRPGIQAEIHSETLRCAIADEACVLVDPAKLVRGLRDVAVRLGVSVYESTPMTALRREGRGVTLETPGGRLSADRAVLAVNAWGSAFPELRRYVLPFHSYVLLTRPLTAEEWTWVGWRRRQGIADRRNFLHYPRPTADGRILWGGRDAAYHAGGPRPEHDHDPRIFGRLEETFRWTFPQLRDVPLEHRWGGPVAVTARFIPASGWLAGERVAYGFGYNGHGVTLSHLNGQILRDLLLGRRTELTELALVRRKPIPFPPALFRDPLVRTSVRALQRADDEGRPGREPLLLRALNRFSR